MRRPLVIAAATTVILLLSGCGAVKTPDADSAATTPAPMITPAAEATPTPTPSVAGALVITTAGLKYTTGGTTRSASFLDGSGLVTLLADAAKVAAPAGVPNPELFATVYTFDGAAVYVADAGTSWMRIESTTIDGIPVHTEAGIGIGSTRAEVKAAGAEDGYDENSDGIADYLDMDFVAQPGVESLAHPGTPGRNFIEAQLRGDQVTMLMVPSNDYSDI